MLDVSKEEIKKENYKMPLKEALKKNIAALLRKADGRPPELLGAEPLHGGDISRSFRLHTSQGDYFLKVNDFSPLLHDVFEKEYRGLQRLIATGAVAVPRPLGYGQGGDESFLLLEYVERQPVGQGFWQAFAAALAALHRNSHDRFGLDEDNYVGSLPQQNGWMMTWPDFYARRRLEPLLRDCVDAGMLEPLVARSAERLYRQLPEIFPPEPPALLHGDLWGGNFMSGHGGVPYLFDPAVYYGHREMDLAMSRLFGGFDRQFYWHYDEVFPLSPGSGERIRLCQLYPLLVHARLFGGGYIQQVRSLLKEY